jgi:hypothetical protein
MMNKNKAQDLMTNMPGNVLRKEDIQIESVSQMGQQSAIVETRLHAAIRFEKVGGRWEPREFRLGHGQWENIESLVSALNMIREDETKRRLGKVADAIVKYCAKNGRLPPFRDFVSLSDALNPVYMTPLIRLDAWDRPLYAELLSAGVVRLYSAGADGQPGTKDDVELIRTFATVETR